LLRPTLYAIALTTLAMTDDNFLPYSFPAISRKQVTAAFDGGRLTSDGGVMLLAMAERRRSNKAPMAPAFVSFSRNSHIVRASGMLPMARLKVPTCVLFSAFADRRSAK
jgi:hypothetical protein